MAIDAGVDRSGDGGPTARALPPGIGAVLLSRTVDLDLLEAAPNPSIITGRSPGCARSGSTSARGIRKAGRLAPVLLRAHMQGRQGADAAESLALIVADREALAERSTCGPGTPQALTTARVGHQSGSRICSSM